MSDLNGLLERFMAKLALEDILISILVLLVCLLAARLLLKLSRRLLDRTKLEERVRRYVLMGLKLLLYTLTVVFTAGSLGVNMNSLVALLSVGSLGVTLAAEDILGNVAGGLVILSSHPFTIGDFIESGGVSGTVEEISLNHTRLLLPDGSTTLLPNKELAASRITNVSALGRRRICWKLTASYDAPTEVVKAACLQAAAATELVLPDPAPEAYLSAFGGSGIEYTVFCWAESQNYWPVYFALGENLREAFGEAGVKIPHNKLDVHILENQNEGGPF